MTFSTRTNRIRLLLGSSCVALAMIAATPALAQTPAAAPEADSADIIVTAQRRSERLQDVPLSVSAITGDALRNANVNNADRLEQVLPGIRLGRSGSDLRPAIRGTYTEIVSANAYPRIGVYVDDIYQSRTSQVPPIVDLDRVEVQKGPQGTLYGRNSFGGNLAFFTAMPKDVFSAGIDASYARYNTARVEAFVNAPLGDGIALRVAGMYERADGFVKNINPAGNDYGGQNTWFARGTLRLAPAALDGRLEVVLRASYQKYGGSGLGGFGYKLLGTPVDTSLIAAPGGTITRNGISYSVPNGFNGASFSGSILLPVDARYKDGIADINGADVGIPQSTDPYQVNYAGAVSNSGSQKQFGGTISFEAGPAKMRSITSYTDFSLTRTGNSLTSTLLNFSYLRTQARTFTQEIQVLSADPSSPFQWILGGYYFDDDVIEKNVTNLNRSYVTATAAAGQQFFGWNQNFILPGGGLSQATGYDSLADYRQLTRSLAGYGQLSYTFGEKLTLTAGLRYTSDQKQLLASAFNRAATGPGSFFAHGIEDPITFECGGFIAANPASVSADPTAIAQAYRFICGKTTQSFFTYRLAADYKFSRNHMVYGSFSTGAHSGGFNTGAVSGNLISFEPERVQAFEIGSKNSFMNGMLTVNVAAFLNNYTNLQAQTSVPNPFNPAAVIALIQNIGKDRAYGIDLESTFRPDDKWTFNFAFNWLHAREIDYKVNTFNFGGAASLCGVTPSCVTSTGEANAVQGTAFPNVRTDPNRFVPLLDASGNPVSVGGIPQLLYVIAGKGRDGTVYTSKKAFQPDYTVQAGVSYKIDLGRSGTLTPEAQFYYNSGYILTDLTPEFGNQKAYTKTDLRLTYRTADERFRIQAFVNNVENTAVLTRAVYAANRTLLANYAVPRTYGISAGFRF
jgi:iron complex outermembrane recepter protein